MKNKRRRSIVCKKMIRVVLTILMIVVAYGVFHTILVSDDATIRQNYEAKQEKYEYINLVVKESIEEGKGIKIHQLSSEGIQYKIYNDGDNIIVYYYVGRENDSYKTTLTLSNNYEILHEEYTEKENFEDYKLRVKVIQKVACLAFGIMVFMMLDCAYCIFKIIYISAKWIVLRVKNLKTKRNDNNSQTE